MAASMLVVLTAAGLVAGAPVQNNQIRSAVAIPAAAKTQLANVAVKRNLGATCSVSQKTKAAAARCAEAQAGPVSVIVSNSLFTSFALPAVGSFVGAFVVQEVIDNKNGTTTLVLSAR